jgi:pimeloyl-ACP methyl ester carboxylesterase
MLVDLLRVSTADGFRLDGALQLPPDAAGRQKLPIDAALLVHGTGGSFYSSTLLTSVADGLLKLGVAVLSANTRGHDLVSTASTVDGPRRQGAAYEDMARCRQDIAAWLDLLADRGLGRVALIGHSSGAIKAVYSQAAKRHAAVERLVAISPPRLSYSHFAASSQSQAFLAQFQEAERLVREGHGERLLDVRFPLPYLVTAAGYVDKYGPDERYSIVPLARQLTVPSLFTFGSQEVATNVAFAELPEAFMELVQINAQLACEVIPGGDHFYTTCRGELVACIERWLRTE